MSHVRGALSRLYTILIFLLTQAMPHTRSVPLSLARSHSSTQKSTWQIECDAVFLCNLKYLWDVWPIFYLAHCNVHTEKKAARQAKDQICSECVFSLVFFSARHVHVPEFRHADWFGLILSPAHTISYIILNIIVTVCVERERAPSTHTSARLLTHSQSSGPLACSSVLAYSLSLCVHMAHWTPTEPKF